jgi:hypothetical protein
MLTGEGGTLGGYLVTNLWGRPLEFRLSSPVRPTKVQQILYGPTLSIYISAELIGKTLVEKTSTPARVILTDQRDVLELRRLIEVPVFWVAPPDREDANSLAAAGLAVGAANPHGAAILAHPDFADDVACGQELFQRVGAGLDVNEPFLRVREAIVEARKMGVSHRAAG